MFKKDFPYFQNSQIVYLDNGATTQKPKAVIDSQVEYYEQYCSNTHRSNFGHANKATQEFIVDMSYASLAKMNDKKTYKKQDKV